MTNVLFRTQRFGQQAGLYRANGAKAALGRVGGDWDYDRHMVLPLPMYSSQCVGMLCELPVTDASVGRRPFYFGLLPVVCFSFSAIKIAPPLLPEIEPHSVGNERTDWESHDNQPAAPPCLHRQTHRTDGTGEEFYSSPPAAAPRLERADTAVPPSPTQLQQFWSWIVSSLPPPPDGHSLFSVVLLLEKLTGQLITTVVMTNGKQQSR